MGTKKSRPRVRVRNVFGISLHAEDQRAEDATGAVTWRRFGKALGNVMRCRLHMLCPLQQTETESSWGAEAAVGSVCFCASESTSAGPAEA